MKSGIGDMSSAVCLNKGSSSDLKRGRHLNGTSELGGNGSWRIREVSAGGGQKPAPGTKVTGYRMRNSSSMIS